MAQPRGTYNRFRIEEDMWLCEEVLKANPFIRDRKAEGWIQIVDALNAIPIFGKPTGERACKHRLEDLLLQYRSGDMAKLRRSGSEEQFQILQDLITQVIHLKEANHFDDDEEERSSSVTEKPVKKPKEKSSNAGKRPFLVSMAQPSDIQRRIAQADLHVTTTPPVVKKPRLLPAPPPITAATPSVPVLAVRVPREISYHASPAVTVPHVVTAAVSDSHSDNNYVSFLIEQNSRQNDLREKEMQQTREIREKELELDRARLEFEERKWEHQLTLLQQQQEMMREMLVQQGEQQKLLFGFLKQLQQSSSEGKTE